MVNGIDSLISLSDFSLLVYKLPWQLSWLRIHLQCRRSWFYSWVRKFPWKRDRLPTPVFLSFFCDRVGKESACSVGDLGLILGFWRYPGEGKGYPLQFSGLENSMDWANFTFSTIIPNFRGIFLAKTLWCKKKKKKTEGNEAEKHTWNSNSVSPNFESSNEIFIECPLHVVYTIW